MVRTTFAGRTVGAFVPYTALVFGLFNTLYIFVQPLSVSGLAVPRSRLGLVYAGFTVAGALGGAVAGRVRDAVGLQGWFAIAPPLFGGLLALAAWLPATDAARAPPPADGG